MIVTLDLFRNAVAGVDEPLEQGLVEQFVAHPAVERLAKSVLQWLAGLDVDDPDATLCRPS
jgi:hypothetical protein